MVTQPNVATIYIKISRGAVQLCDNRQIRELEVCHRLQTGCMYTFAQSCHPSMVLFYCSMVQPSFSMVTSTTAKTEVIPLMSIIYTSGSYTQNGICSSCTIHCMLRTVGRVVNKAMDRFTQV